VQIQASEETRILAETTSSY